MNSDAILCENPRVVSLPDRLLRLCGSLAFIIFVAVGFFCRGNRWWMDVWPYVAGGMFLSVIAATRSRMMGRMLGYAGRLSFFGWVATCFLLGIILFLAVPFPLLGIQENGGFDRAVTLIRVAVYAGSAIILLGSMLLCVTSAIVLRERPVVRPQAVSRWWILILAAPAISWWFLILSRFWPGILTNDSFDQWGQMLSGRYVDHHPVFHTLSNRFCTVFWLSPASIAIVQIVALAGAAGVLLYCQMCRGVQRRLAVVLAIGFALWPANGLMAVTLWKDVAYAIALLLFMTCMFEIAASRGAWLHSRYGALLLGGAGALCALFRHNGLPVVLVTLALLLVFACRHRKAVLAALAIVMVTVASVRGPLYSALDVERDTALRNAKLTNICFPFVMAHAMHGTALSPGQKAVLQDIYAGDWRRPYSEYAIQGIYYDPLFRKSVLYGKRSDDINRLCLELFKANPWIHFKHFLHGSEYIWAIQPRFNHRYEQFGCWMNGPHVVFSTLRAGAEGMYPVERVAKEQPLPLASLLLRFSTRHSWLATRTAIYFYMLVMLSICATLRSRNILWLFMALPVVLHTGLLLIAISFASNFRYQYPVMVVGLLMIPFLILCVPREGEIPEHELRSCK